MITRETDYALRILRALYKADKLTAAEICEKEYIPKQFTYKIIRKLKDAEFIHITRGVEGGCCLTANLNKLSLYDLMVALDALGPVNACLSAEFQCDWKNHNNNYCKIHAELFGLEQRINQELKSYALTSFF